MPTIICVSSMVQPRFVTDIHAIFRPCSLDFLQDLWFLKLMPVELAGTLLFLRLLSLNSPSTESLDMSWLVLEPNVSAFSTSSTLLVRTDEVLKLCSKSFCVTIAFSIHKWKFCNSVEQFAHNDCGNGSGTMEILLQMCSVQVPIYVLARTKIGTWNQGAHSYFGSTAI